MNWLQVSDTHTFSIHNLPYGMFDLNGQATPGIAIGDSIINLRACAANGWFSEMPFSANVFDANVLNPFISSGKVAWTALRNWTTESLLNPNSELAKNRDQVLADRLSAKMYLPIHIGDYTDFYSSIEHATNVGMMFRDPANALLPNWRHLPVGYHGRASSIVISGTDVIRPKGQTMPPDAKTPVFGPCKRLDFELEMAFVIGKENKLGEAIPVDEAESYIFGMVVFNDWSARDIQTWEYVPLGPFLSKNFASTVSPWIVTMDALNPFRCESIKQEPPVLPYLNATKPGNFDIALEVTLTAPDGTETVISKSNFKYMYWDMAQQLAHHTVNGCNVRVGDLMASGTISGHDKNSYGSMLELSWGGKNKIELANGETRTFIEDGDTITMRATCNNGEIGLGFGDCTGKVLKSI